MRKIVVHMMLSLDGYFEGPDHDLSWHLVDEELHAHFNEQLATNSAFLEGRVSYELMEAVWPTADQNPDNPPTMREFAGIWRAVPKSCSPARCMRSAPTPRCGQRWISTRCAH
jgi:dihydrofolate reductase